MKRTESVCLEFQTMYFHSVGSLLFQVLLVSILVAISTQESSFVSCPKFNYCSAVGPQPPCQGDDADNECPGGRPACYTNPDSNQVVSCCCIKYNPIYKHLIAGAQKPSRVSDKLRVYFMRFCPYSHRVMLVSHAKNVSTDVVFLNLKNKPEWFATSLGGKVPIIETDDGSINESLPEADFLDEKYLPRGELYPSNAFLKAKDRILVENYNKLMPGLLFDILYGKGLSNPSEAPALVKQFEDEIARLGTELKRRGTEFFGGNGRPGMVDYMIWPWIERSPVLRMYNPVIKEFSAISVAMADWVELMKADPSVKTFGLAPEVHFEYAASQRAGSPDYDMLAGF